MPPEDRDVVDFLAEHYPSPIAARTLWERAGGRVMDVPHGAERPRDQWHLLWRNARAGGHATPTALVREALLDFPGSKPLLRWLRAESSAEEKEVASAVVTQIAHLDEPLIPATLAQLLRPLTPSRDGSFAQIAPALEGQIEAPRRSKIVTALQQIASGATSKVLESVAKGVTEALMATSGWTP